LAELVGRGALRHGLFKTLILFEPFFTDRGFDTGVNISLVAGEEAAEAIGVATRVDALLAGGSEHVHRGGLAFDEEIFEFIELRGR
jgi:hypothetical protein